MKVLRVYHAGRDRAHRARERALARAGAEVTLIVPRVWPDNGCEQILSAEPDFAMVELDVTRPGDVNRHGYPDQEELRSLIRRIAPDVIDVHEEPVSVSARQWLAAAESVPVVMYTAQNIDKRFPPPFHAYERSALRRATGLYPCSAQAASVARGKGYDGPLEVLPLGIDLGMFTPGDQETRSHDTELVLGLVGRMVPEKGAEDAVRVLEALLYAGHRARLELVGNGPALPGALRLATELAVAGRVRHTPWADAESLAAAYRRMDVVLVPSRATATWVEQFGRVVIEAQAAGAVVAAYASGSIPEVVGDSGVLVAEGNLPALGSAVVALAADRSRIAVLRTKGFANATAADWAHVAGRQIELYQRATAHARKARHDAVARIPSPSARRAAAVAEFGRPARVLGQDRPFALPVLRNPTALGRVLGRTVDRLAR